MVTYCVTMLVFLCVIKLTDELSCFIYVQRMRTLFTRTYYIYFAAHVVGVHLPTSSAQLLDACVLSKANNQWTMWLSKQQNVSYIWQFLFDRKTNLWISVIWRVRNERHTHTNNVIRSDVEVCNICDIYVHMTTHISYQYETVLVE